MKHIETFNENTNSKLNTIKHSELNGDWSVKKINNKKIRTGQKEFDIDLSKKILDFINKEGFDIVLSGGEFFQGRYDNLCLNDENLFEEHRFELSRKIDYDDFLHDYLIDNGFDSIEDMSNDERDKMNSYYESIPAEPVDDGCEFSVFLPVKKYTDEEMKLCAISDGFNYFKMLYDCFSEKNGFRDLCHLDDIMQNNMNGFKKYLNHRNIVIKNDNLEDILPVEYRIYKDSKFFYNFYEYNGTGKIIKFLESLI